MKKKFFSFLLLLLLASSQAMACRCANPGPKRAYAGADAVVWVKIKAVEQVREDMARMETEVFQSWKSKVTEDMDILTVFSETVVCPYVGQEGETHLLYLKRSSSLSEEFRAGKPEGFWTNNCMGNWSESYPQATKHIQWLNRYGRKT